MGLAGGCGTYVFRAGHSHDAEKGAQRNRRGREGRSGFAFQLPVKEVGLTEAIFEEAEAFNHAGQSPIGVSR